MGPSLRLLVNDLVAEGVTAWICDRVPCSGASRMQAFPGLKRIPEQKLTPFVTQQYNEAPYNFLRQAKRNIFCRVLTVGCIRESRLRAPLRHHPVLFFLPFFFFLRTPPPDTHQFMRQLPPLPPSGSRDMIPPTARTPLLCVYNSHPPVACCRGGEHKDSALASIHCFVHNRKRLSLNHQWPSTGSRSTNHTCWRQIFVCVLKGPPVCASFSARRPDTMTDFEAEQAAELEALEAIYNEDLQTLAPGHWLITLSRDDADRVFRVQLDVECPPNYPEVPPALRVIPLRDVTEGQADTLTAEVCAAAEGCVGDVMVFGLVSQLQASLEDLSYCGPAPGQTDDHRPANAAEEDAWPDPSRWADPLEVEGVGNRLTNSAKRSFKALLMCNAREGLAPTCVLRCILEFLSRLPELKLVQELEGHTEWVYCMLKFQVCMSPVRESEASCKMCSPHTRCRAVAGRHTVPQNQTCHYCSRETELS